jgi:RHS repeat-associated protein
MLFDGQTTHNTTYTYNAANQLLTSQLDSDPLRSYSYDLAGNLLNDGQNQYRYDGAERLIGYTDGRNGFVTSYAYNGQGDRLRRTHNGLTTTYLLDLNASLTQVLGETSNGQERRYLLGLDVLGQQTGNQWSYFGYDGLGSVRQVMDAAGTLQSQASFDPYGNPFEQFGGQTAAAFGFTGEQTDPNGLLFLRARYYHPGLGTFLSLDPKEGAAGDAMSFNRYAYAAANPVNLTDPSGLDPDELFPFLDPIRNVVRTGLTRAGQAADFILHNPEADFAVLRAAGMAIRCDPLGALLGAVNGVASMTIYPLLDLMAVGSTASLVSQALGMGSPREMLTAMAWSGLNELGVRDIRQSPGYQVGNFVGQAVGLLGDIVQVPNMVKGAVQLARWGVRRAARAARSFTGAAEGLGETETLGSGLLEAGAFCSFSADTQVATDQGQRPISTLKEGDNVLAYDQQSGTTETHKVQAVLKHDDPVIVHLTIDDEQIETTPEHPFYTLERGWVNAGELKVGEHVRKADGGYGRVQKVEREQRQQTMYNLTVEKAHTFFVGQGRWLVHNACETPKPLTKPLGKVDPKTVRFTQDSIGRTFKNKIPLEETIALLKADPSKAADFPPIRVFESEGSIWTLDNRRLYVFQQAGIPIETVPATAEEIASESFKFTTVTDGLSIVVRTGGGR